MDAIFPHQVCCVIMICSVFCCIEIHIYFVNQSINSFKIINLFDSSKHNESLEFLCLYNDRRALIREIVCLCVREHKSSTNNLKIARSYNNN